MSPLEVSIYICSGDFAQLPPARSGAPLYSGSVGNQVDSGQWIGGQEAAIGKALWHQVNNCCYLATEYETRQAVTTRHQR